MWLLLAVVGGVVFSELVGYIVHRLIHSGKIEFLSKNHMEHHLREYGPKMPMRTENYHRPNVVSFGSLGLEWWIPLAIVCTGSFVGMLLAGLSFKFVAVFMGIAIAWGVLMFSYMHDALHLNKFWMLEDRALFKWFKKVRKLHDIHHLKINNSGRMDVNFGICFFWMDKLFGTYEAKMNGFNESGYNKTKQLYAHIYQDKDVA